MSYYICYQDTMLRSKGLLPLPYTASSSISYLYLCFQFLYWVTISYLCKHFGKHSSLIVLED